MVKEICYQIFSFSYSGYRPIKCTQERYENAHRIKNMSMREGVSFRISD